MTTIRESWETYAKDVLSDSTKQDKAIAMATFYSGALCVGAVIMGIMQNNVLSEETKGKRFQALLNELAMFAAYAQHANKLRAQQQQHPEAEVIANENT